MINRLLKWFATSIGLTILPIILSVILHSTFSIPIHFSDYTAEFLFMAVTLSATSIGDIISLIRKGVSGIHITIMVILIVTITIICMGIYEMVSIGAALEKNYNHFLINVLTICGCTSSLIIGIFCQIFLQKIEGAES